MFESIYLSILILPRTFFKKIILMISNLRIKKIFRSVAFIEKGAGCRFGGGVVRGLVGFIKHQYSYKNVSFNLAYFSAIDPAPFI
ncbi:hypothetical protein J7J37_00915 [bacterium]|nr:hypothetical protein [bacterium]